ncbi:MAG: carboxypeptidase-like regulatory domain-containing protein [Gemmataceae bacterium]
MRLVLGVLAGLLLIGCGSRTEQAEKTVAIITPDAWLARAFDPAQTGTIAGLVTWSGAVPAEPSQHAAWLSLIGPPGPCRGSENPLRPRIDASTGGVGNAVVFLRGVDVEKSRPWDHAPVEIEMKDYQIILRQQEHQPRYAFARRGEMVNMVSRQPAHHSLHADGAAFFTLSFPNPDQPLQRRLANSGIVELSSGIGYFWMRGYVFVSDHPYYAATDAQGQFELPQVPAGEYEIVAWMPNWKEVRRELDPETGQIVRLVHGTPAVKKQLVLVGQGTVATVGFTFREEDFNNTGSASADFSVRAAMRQRARTNESTK